MKESLKDHMETTKRKVITMHQGCPFGNDKYVEETLRNEFFSQLDTTLGIIIDKKINGNLREIKSHLEKQDVKLDSLETKVDALKPLQQGLTVVNLLRSFLLWATPAAAVLWGVLKYLTK